MQINESLVIYVWFYIVVCRLKILTSSLCILAITCQVKLLVCWGHSWLLHHHFKGVLFKICWFLCLTNILKLVTPLELCGPWIGYANCCKGWPWSSFANAINLLLNLNTNFCKYWTYWVYRGWIGCIWVT